jgi:hypothetical protein
MPPRRNTRASAAAEREVAARSARVVAAAQHAAPALAPLPHALVLHILSLLPVDCRLLCAGVCRSWRAALEERSLWLRLDLSASGVSPKREATDALLHAAAARSGGQLQSLDVTNCTRLASDAVLSAVIANAGALRELRICGFRHRWLGVNALQHLLRAAPRLAVCDTDVVCGELSLAHRLLCNEAPFAPLHLRTFEFDGAEADVGDAAVLALAAETASHAHLRRLDLNDVPLNTAAALDAVVDAALTRQLTSVTLMHCNLSPESVPALVRLVGGSALAELDIYGADWQLLDAAGALALGNALRASSTLTAVSLWSVQLWRDPAAATALLGALTGHPSLRSLNIAYNRVDLAGQEEAGVAIGALVAANAPALTVLDVSRCLLGDAGLRPLFDALPHNTHLRTLGCTSNSLSDAFVRDALLPAVRANSILRELKTGLHNYAVREVEALVQRRASAP